MKDLIHAVLSNADAFRWIFLLALLFVFYRWMQSDNGIEWRDFVSGEKPDGTYRGDINRVGQCVGVVVAAFSVIATAPKAYTDYVGFAAVLGVCLAFLGGVAAYAATLRAKATQVQTTTVTEPVPEAPVKTTVTTTEPATPMASTGEAVPVKIVGGAGVEDPLKVDQEKPK